MPPAESSARVAQARAATSDQLRTLLHDMDEQVLLALLEHPNLEESHVCQMLERLDLPAAVLSAVAAERKWVRREPVRLRLAQHPRTPRRIALALARQLYLFDLVRVSLKPSAPAEVRRLAEEVILSQLPHLPIGEKLTLARRGPGRVAGAILVEGHPQAALLSLDNAFLNEGQVLRALSRPEIRAHVVAAIARHRKWSHQYNVRMALIRNPQTPLSLVLGFLPDITAHDLRELCASETLPANLRHYILREVGRRVGTHQVSTRPR